MRIVPALDNARVDAMTAYHPDDLGANQSGNILSAAYNGITAILGAAGMVVADVAATTTSNILKMGLPMAQAVLLMAVYAILPFVVVFSRYSLGVMLAAAIALFSIHFWTVLWRLAAWVDENLLQAMFPGALDLLLYSLSDPSLAPGGMGAPGAMSKTLFFDLLLMAMLVGMPILWSVMLGWAGVKVVSHLNDLTKSFPTGQVESAGSTGARVASSAVRRGR